MDRRGLLSLVIRERGGRTQLQVTICFLLRTAKTEKKKDIRDTSGKHIKACNQCISRGGQLRGCQTF